eukprot:TRINITY_DN339_c0_g1_i1.p1 TRINITY_DN339_c0_g1~~TRINITY_DN339_c0_g1_i1.p1  ORF type:complete len:459 (-),score=101.46 TRINITY_DN339_c0_g1_i1:121-1497(-)
MSTIRVARTHRLWQDLKAANLPATSLSSQMNNLPQTTFLSLSPQTRAAVVAFDNMVEAAARPSAVAIKEYNAAEEEPNWAYWEKKLGGHIDVKMIRDKVLGLDASSEAAKEESNNLHKWYLQLAKQVTQQEKAELKEAFDVRVSELNTPEEKSKLGRDFESQLSGLPQEIEDKLRIYAQIDSIDYRSLPSGKDVPALPNREELKEYYDIDFQLSDADAQKLQKWHQSLDRELNAARRFPNPAKHLLRTYEWDLAHAKSEEAKQSVQAAYAFKRRFLAAGSESPQDLEPRLKDALTLKFLKSQNPGFKVETREELYDAVDQLSNRKEYDDFLQSAKDTAARDQLDEFRQKNPTSAINVWMTESEKLCELVWDEWNMAKDLMQSESVKWRDELARLENRLANADQVSINEIAAEHPEWEEEARKRVRGSYWDPDVSIAEVDKDRAKMEAKKHIWWEKDHH